MCMSLRILALSGENFFFCDLCQVYIPRSYVLRPIIIIIIIIIIVVVVISLFSFEI